MNYAGERIGTGTAAVVERRRGGVDQPFAALTLLLLTIGVVTVLSASYARAYYSEATGHNAAYYFMRQLASPSRAWARCTRFHSSRCDSTDG